MKASIIVPSYNSKERLYYNLLSLNNQDYDFNEFEVVVVDNGSNDNTIDMLRSFESKAKFKLKYARIEENKGIARGRNTAIKMADGEILIFHDSDMIAPKDFVSRHVKNHDEKNVVVCGISWKRIITFYYKELEKKDDGYKGLDYIRKAPIKIDKVPIINESSVINGQYIKYSFDLEEDFIKEVKGILQRYNGKLNEYALPWRLFITNNASVEREKVINVGMFDESIIAYGFEDYDLGIRLYKSGCKFVFDGDILNVHQEHPTNIKIDQFKDNINYICHKYNFIYFIDVILVCMSYLTSINKANLNELVLDINKMLKRDKFKFVLEVFLEMLQIQRLKNYNDNQRINFSIDLNKIKKSELINMSIALDKIYGLKYFSKAMKALINDVYN